jgi:hypothetical protein
MEHTCPAAQAVPHAPQCARSVCTSRQTPPQSVRPAPHDTWHTPMEHTCPAAHDAPQAPQLTRSFCWSRQVPWQFVSPAAHET